jgi:CBS-domain-containing membrane protein
MSIASKTVEEQPLNTYFSKMRGGAACPPRASIRHIAISWLGGCLAIGVVAYMAIMTNTTLMLGSFGATCVLVFGFPESPFSQPRNVIAGHFLSSLVGLLFLTLLGAHWWSVALAAGTAIALMQLTRTVHPPAGSNPVIVMLTAPAWNFLLTPTLIGAMILVVVAVIFNNFIKERTYPKYWL